MISEYHNVRTRFRTEAHASWQEMQQEQPAQAWRSTRSCTSMAQLEEPAEAWHSTRACTSMACKNHRDSKQSRNKRPLTHPSHGNNISGEISITIIRGQGNHTSGEAAINHNHSEKIDAAHETVSQHKAYGAMHLRECRRTEA